MVLSGGAERGCAERRHGVTRWVAHCIGERSFFESRFLLAVASGLQATCQATVQVTLCMEYCGMRGVLQITQAATRSRCVG